MTRLNERIQTSLPIVEAFEYLADFANSAEWDPGVASSDRVGEGDVGVGTRYRLGIRRGERVTPMEYVITAFEPPTRVVLHGEGSGVTAEDEIRFEPRPDGAGSIVDYTADIRLQGLRRIAEPFLGGMFRKIAQDAADGIERTLERRAAERGRS